ncbi:hypothetical protein B10904_10130 [Campylobacter jejuni]|nr:hypothetical protein B10904_10130 [Campylobacter jejuni]
MANSLREKSLIFVLKRLISPLFGLKFLSISFKRVLLPEPFGPKIPIKAWFLSSK